jgi:REP element-mobilizing transposase RayT
MPRRPRPILDGGLYHVWARGIDRRDLFTDDRDRRAYLAILNDACDEFCWIRLAYCLMSNHVHLLLETPSGNLSQGMQRLQSRYAQRFNLRHEKSGHVFEGRFGSTLISSDEQLVAVTRYIANNPVEVGLCAEPPEWPWTNTVVAEARCAGAR